ncbi:MAG TPA: glutathionylspermidine synthase family protein [Candidatus Sulfotelmatobacter sp.]|nr:glutathionylspermidine synthase family protein [Candidatus Sulfotelmatobacter sp.]
MNTPWEIAEPIDAKTFAEIRREAIFDCCKWDPQVEDVCTLSPLPLVLTADAWAELVSLAEQLARETVAAEAAVLQSPRLLRQLGLPWTLRRRLVGPEILERRSRHLRLIRFDFHFTTEGWRISEANTDVPGGFNEASGFTKLIAQHYRNLAPAGDPTREMARAIAEIFPAGGAVALVHATSFSDDRQVMVYLARRLQEAGLKAVLAAPDHLHWENGRAFLRMGSNLEPLHFIFRFFPADWLTALSRRCAWWHLLGGSQIPLCNPGLAIISQSKRFPLVWDKLGAAMPAWNALLPRTFDVRQTDRTIPTESLVFKPAFGRVGDMIKMEGVTSENEKRGIDRSIRRYPKTWIAQKRFEAVPMRSPVGDVYPCVGVYTLNARVIGAYGRMARRPLIDHLAQDAGVLVKEPEICPSQNQLIRTIHHETSGTLRSVGA